MTASRHVLVPDVAQVASNSVAMNRAMAKPTANLRLFVAAYPPVDISQQMIDAINLLKLPPHRLTPIEQIHVTLQFIGDTPSRDLDDVIESVRRSAARLNRFILAPQRLVTFPERGPARLIACETDAPPTLMELHRRLVQRLATNVRSRRDERFRPHFTLCRFASPVRGMKVDQPIATPEFEIATIHLMRSTLSASGATHHAVAAIELE